MRKLIPLFAAVFIILSFAKNKTVPKLPSVIHHLPSDTILYPGEKHFKNVQQLTFGGDNAEAY